MKKFVFCLCVALLTIISSEAQQISVVSPSGTTTLFRTLQESIEGASDGSVIYLPGGGFQISDEVKITKKLTIIGIGYYVNNGNADGVTTISGNLWFNEGSSGSAVMGCYITGNVNIGDGGASVNDVLIRQCNINSVQVHNSQCQETVVNQNYIRNGSAFGHSTANISNNIIHSIVYVDGGSILNNIIIGYYNTYWGATAYDDVFRIIEANSSYICYNIMFGLGKSRWGNNAHVGGSNNHVFENMSGETVGETCININAGSWNDVFVNYNNATISPISDFHFTDDYKQYENQVGIYAGTGFNKQVTSVPYIIYKDVPTETDVQGMLKVKIRVKANQ